MANIVEQMAEQFVLELIGNKNTPQAVLNQINNRLKTDRARGLAFRAAVQTFRDNGQPLATRLAALDKIVDFMQGEA